MMEHETYHAIERSFIEGFRQAPDKPSFLRLARIPLELPRPEQPGLKLMQVVIEDIVDVGRASPGFASRELVYHPLPNRLVTTQCRLRFRYVSADDVHDLSLADLLEHTDAISVAEHGHSHHHHAHGHS